MQGLAGGVTAGDTTDQLLQGAGAAQTLEVAHQGETAISLLAPAQPLAFGELHPQADRLAIVGEAPQHARWQWCQTQVLQRCGQQR